MVSVDQAQIYFQGTTLSSNNLHESHSFQLNKTVLMFAAL